MYSIRFHQSDTKPMTPSIPLDRIKKAQNLEKIIIPTLRKQLEEAERELQLLRRNN